MTTPGIPVPDRAALIGKVMGELSTLQREIVRMLVTFEDDIPDDALAARHGITAGAVKVQRSIVRMRLQAVLRQDRPDDPR